MHRIVRGSTFVVVFSAISMITGAEAALGYNSETRARMQEAAEDVAWQQEKRYDTVLMSKNSTFVDLCVQEGIVAAAYLSANSREDYDYWKKTESSNCDKAQR